MKLTEKEFEVMLVLWKSETPMTSGDIVRASENRTWQPHSIFSMMKLLLAKGLVAFSHYEPTTSRFAMAFKPTFTPEEYYARHASAFMDRFGAGGVNVDILVKEIKKVRKQREAEEAEEKE